MRRLLPAIAALLVLLPGSAYAGSFDVFGYGARGIGLGGAMTATADDHTAVYYNPAGLARRDVVQLGTDIYTSVPSLNLDLSADPPRLLRAGAISRRQIEDIVGPLE